MTKYYYLAIGCIVGLLIIAVTILSKIDRSILNPAGTDTSAHSGHLTTSPYHMLSSGPQDDDPSSSQSPRTKTIKDTAQPPALDLRLVGTTVWGEKSSAIIADLIKGTQGVYRVGDSIKGFTLTKILQDSVTLKKKEQEVVLTLAKGGAFLPGEFVRRIDNDSWMVSADKLSNIVSNVDQYVGQVIAFQHRENGTPAGFLIRHLQPGNDFEKLGIENGDIIKKVNGLEVNDLSDTLEAVYKLGSETTFNLEVVRNGQPHTLHYTLDKSVNPLVPLISNMLKTPTGSKKP